MPGLDESEQAEIARIAAAEEADLAGRRQALCDEFEAHRAAWADEMLRNITAV